MSRELEYELTGGPYAVTAARLALSDIDEVMDESLAFDVRLLVSELVTNSVRHSDAHSHDLVHMSVSVTETSLRVEVADPGKGFEPKPRDADRTRPGGWGLYLVDQLSDRWGVGRDHLTRVWFEMDHGRYGVAA